MNTTYECWPMHDFAPVLEVAGEPEMHLTASAWEDSQRLLEVVRENRTYLEEYQWWCHNIHTQQDAEEHVSNTLQCMADRRWVQYRINPGGPETEQPWVGTVTLYDHAPRSHSIKLGYWLTEEAQGNGFAFRSAERLLSYGQEALGITKVTLDIARGNERSESLAAKLGCRIVGRQSARKIDDGIRTRTLLVRKWAKDLDEVAA